MELSALWRALVRRRWVALAVFAVVFLFTVRAALTPPDQYRADATISVQPPINGDTYAGLQLVHFLIPTLETQLFTPAMGPRVARALDTTPEELPGHSVATSVEPGTGLMFLSVTSTDPQAVAPLANAYAQALIDAQPADFPLNISVISRAQDPSTPSGPARTVMLVTGTTFGVVLAVIAALLAQAFFGRRRLADQIAEDLRVPLLGEVPAIRHLSRDAGPEEILASEDRLAVEYIMRLRTNFELNLTQRRLRSVAITSQATADGKSTIASTLTWAMARAGHRMTLVEADVRRPSLEPRLLGGRSATRVALGTRIGINDNGGGVLFVSSRDLTQEALEQRDTPHAMHPTDIVSAALPPVLERTVEPGGTVIVDCPPLLGAAESRLVLAMVDGVIVVANARDRNVLQELRKTILDVETAGAVVLGVVLNRSRVNARHAQKVAQYYIAPQKAVGESRGVAHRRR